MCVLFAVELINVLFAVLREIALEYQRNKVSRIEAQVEVEKDPHTLQELEEKLRCHRVVLSVCEETMKNMLQDELYGKGMTGFVHIHIALINLFPRSTFASVVYQQSPSQVTPMIERFEEEIKRIRYSSYQTIY